MIELGQQSVLHRHRFPPPLSLARAASCALLLGATGCTRAEAPQAPPLTAPISGALTVDGLAAPVRVVRDRWGIPHIYATSQNDLFLAQGFVQAQDRLFQMDLWRRAAQGRLSEVLGPNFIERDAMTRRVQYDGDPAADWARYGPDARTIAAAFVQGVNAWVRLAREHPPEAFVLAGWQPEPWAVDDLLNRTDAVVENAGVLDDAARAGFGDVVGDAIRRAGAPPFFTGLSAPVPLPRSASRAHGSADRELPAPGASIPLAQSFVTHAGSTLEFAESSGRFINPSARYLVHLVGAGWNAIGVTAPWRPGVAAGHNERVAWAFAPSNARTQTVRAVPDTHPVLGTVKRTIAVKGRDEPFSFETESTADGIVIATDRATARRFVFDWVGFESGAAPELMSLALDRAANRRDAETAIRGWKLPARSFVVVDAAEPPARPRRDTPAPPMREVRPTRVVFAHVLGVTEQARRRYDIGPVSRGVNDQPVRLSIDVRSWDQSKAMNAPGQSENPDSAHFADLVIMWSSGYGIPLAFSDTAVQAGAEATLTLLPGHRTR